MYHIHLESCESTQLEIEKLLKKDTIQNYLISSKTQTHGRGQYERSWWSTSNALAMSFNTQASQTLSLTSLEMGVQVVDFFKKLYQLDLKLKWPNDIFFKEKKCGGILLKKNASLICGIGLNLFHDNELPSHIDSVATLFSKPLEDVKSLTENIYHYINNNRLTDFEIRSRFEQSCLHLGRPVLVTEGNESFSGQFIGIDKNGGAKVLTKDELKVFYSASLKVL